MNLQKAELIQSPRRSQEGVRLLKIWVIHPLVFGGFFVERCLQNLPKPAGTPNILMVLQSFLGGGFKYVLFSPLFGEDSHFD